MKTVVGTTASTLVGVMAAFAAQAQTAAPSAEVNVTNDTKYSWGEAQIAVNPKDPNNIVFATVGVGFTKECQEKSPACKMVNADLGLGRPFPQPMGMFSTPKFNAVFAFTSFDRGKTWTRYDIPATPRDRPHIKESGDPSVTVTPDGTFYFSFDAFDWGTPEKALPAGGIGVSKSTDGGRTWSTPVLTGTPLDGPKITADPVTGTIYGHSSTTLGPRSTGDPSAPAGTVMDRWLVSSKDGVTWTKPQPMGGGGHISSAAHGLLAAAFKTAASRSMFDAPNNELCGSAPTPCTIFQTTGDGGATWSRHVMSVPNTHSGFALVAADPAAKGHFAVGLSMKSGGEFHVYQTRDAGKSWSGPAIVTQDASKQHFHAWMAYSPKAVLGLMWRTRQPAPGQKLAPPSEMMPMGTPTALQRLGGSVQGWGRHVQRTGEGQHGRLACAARRYVRCRGG